MVTDFSVNVQQYSMLHKVDRIAQASAKNEQGFLSNRTPSSHCTAALNVAYSSTMQQVRYESILNARRDAAAGAADANDP